MRLKFQKQSASEFVSRIIPPQAEGNMSVVMNLTFQERSE